MIPTPKSHDELVRAADDTRAKWLHAIVRLDRRGRDAAEASKRVVADLRHFRLGRLSMALAGTCMTVIVVYEVVTRRSGERRRSRWRLFKNAWRRPERERPAKRPFLLEVARSLLVSLVASALAAPLRRVAERSGE
jgi:hypothetical protein